MTDAQGEFRFIGLTPGNYARQGRAARASGRRSSRTCDVGIGQTVDVPLAMTVGGLTETVDVVANAVTIDTTTTATDTNMSQDLLFTMPLGARQPGDVEHPELLAGRQRRFGVRRRQRLRRTR